MARLRRAVSYRRLERPYTRISKFRKKSVIKTSYNPRITKFVMGNTKKEDFPVKVKLLSDADIQIRENSIESASLTSNRLLEKRLGKNYKLRINKYPYHVLRNNPIASGAGADRFSTGMKKSFGKPIGFSAQFKKGDSIMEANVEKRHMDIAKKALKRAAHKFACGCRLQIIEK